MTSYASNGAVTTVNTQTSGDQLRQSVTKLADGTLVAVWESTNTTQDGNGSAIVMRHLDAAGLPIGGEIVVDTQTAGNQLKPQVSALAGGGYVVTWETADGAQDGNGTAVKAQVFDAAGLPVGSEFRVNTLTALNQQQPTITGLADGSFVVAWQTTDSAQDGTGWAIKGQHFSAAGAPIGSEFLINTSAFGSQNNADIASLADGGFVVTWQVGASGSSTSYARVYDVNGVAAGNEISVANYSGAFDTAVVGLADGGFSVTYSRGGAIFVQRFDAAHAKIGGEVFVGEGLLPEIATLTEGGFIVTWRGNSSQLGARTFDANGTATGDAMTINGVSTGTETSVVALSGGGFALFASHIGTSTGQDVQLRLFQVANSAPELGAATRAISVAENGTAIATITAIDDGGPSPLTYAIVGGADAARFAINAQTGALSFVTAPDREAPSDAGGNNVYDVIVKASDGALSDSQAIAVTVTNVNEAPVITSNGGGASAALQLDENATAVTTVAAADVDSPVTYAIAGGPDAALFVIDQTTGELRFASAPDFEAPEDADHDNVYDVIVSASDGNLGTAQSISVTVGNVNEGLAITSFGGGASAVLAIAENTTAVGSVLAVDPDGDAISYAIAGGADAERFAIDAQTGALRFIAAPDHEAPADAGSDNVYDVIVSATDGTFTDIQALTVTVTDAREGNVITGNSAANTLSTTNGPAGQPRATELEDTIYGLGGNDTISAAGGEDIVDGGAGNDKITGGAGADILTGGIGADRFIYAAIGDSTVGAPDLITDFHHAEGDLIDLKAIDARSSTAGNQAFVFIGDAIFSGQAGQLRFEHDAADTWVMGDVNGDRAADFLIQLSGLISLSSADFVL